MPRRSHLKKLVVRHLLAFEIGANCIRLALVKEPERPTPDIAHELTQCIREIHNAFIYSDQIYRKFRAAIEQRPPLQGAPREWWPLCDQ